MFNSVLVTSGTSLNIDEELFDYEKTQDLIKENFTIKEESIISERQFNPKSQKLCNHLSKSEKHNLDKLNCISNKSLGINFEKNNISNNLDITTIPENTEMIYNLNAIENPSFSNIKENIRGKMMNLNKNEYSKQQLAILMSEENHIMKISQDKNGSIFVESLKFKLGQFIPDKNMYLSIKEVCDVKSVQVFLNRNTLFRKMMR